MEKYRSLSWAKEMKKLKEDQGQQKTYPASDERYHQPKPQEPRKPRSLFWSVFLSIIAAVVTLSILAFGVRLAFLGAAVSAITSSFERTLQKPKTSPSPKPAQGHTALDVLPPPIKQTTKAVQDAILEMGRKNLDNANKIQREAKSAVKNKRPMRNALADDSKDMPPWEHPHRWGKISSEHGTCWYHNDTMRKVCQ